MSETHMTFCGEPIRFMPSEAGAPLMITGDPDSVEMFGHWMNATVRELHSRRKFEAELIGRLDHIGFQAYLNTPREHA